MGIFTRSRTTLRKSSKERRVQFVQAQRIPFAEADISIKPTPFMTLSVMMSRYPPIPLSVYMIMPRSGALGAAGKEKESRM